MEEVVVVSIEVVEVIMVTVKVEKYLTKNKEKAKAGEKKKSI